MYITPRLQANPSALALCESRKEVAPRRVRRAEAFSAGELRNGGTTRRIGEFMRSMSELRLAGAYWAAQARMDSRLPDDYGIYDATDNTQSATIGAPRSTLVTAYGALAGTPPPIRYDRRHRTN